MTFADGALVAGAAACAGATNAIAGGGSLISFSALLAVGYAPVTANVTNTVGVLPGYLGGAIGYAPELRGQEERVGALALTSAVGAVVGAVLLIASPAAVFELVAPMLILISCALLAAQPRLSHAIASRGGGGEQSVSLQAGQFAAALYGGYFAAGFGVLLLAVLGLLIPGEDLQRLNALKALLSLVIGAGAAVTYALVGPVAWSAAGVMAAGSCVGGLLGVRAARRLPPTVLRWGIVGLGAVVAMVLLAR